MWGLADELCGLTHDVVGLPGAHLCGPGPQCPGSAVVERGQGLLERTGRHCQRLTWRSRRCTYFGSGVNSIHVFGFRSVFRETVYFKLSGSVSYLLYSRSLQVLNARSQVYYTETKETNGS